MVVYPLPPVISVALEGKDKVCKEEVIPILVELLSDPESEVRASAAGALVFATITTQEIRTSREVLGKLIEIKANKSTEPDNLHPRVPTEVTREILDALVVLFQDSDSINKHIELDLICKPLKNRTGSIANHPSKPKRINNKQDRTSTLHRRRTDDVTQQGDNTSAIKNTSSP
eukprot:g37448.t1